MDTFDLLSQYNINGEDPLGALYDQDPIFLADGDAVSGSMDAGLGQTKRGRRFRQ